MNMKILWHTKFGQFPVHNPNLLEGFKKSSKESCITVLPGCMHISDNHSHSKA